MALGERTVDQLLEALHVTTPFGVETGEVRGAHGSATESVARENAADLLQNQRYFAHRGSVHMFVTRDQIDALRRQGAPDEGVQVIRSFKHGELNVTFSDRCSGCQRWIHLGEAEREGICFCGKTYRVVFDRTPEDWTMKQRQRCMDCGVESGYSLVGSGLNPWNLISGHQVQCDACEKKAA